MRIPIAFTSVLVLLSVSALAAPADDAAAKKEKAKASAEPFANDLGPAALTDAQLKALPAAVRKGHDLMIVRCAQCHTAARPLNSQIKDADAWKRYVKRMMAKPGCTISPKEGAEIWKFLVEDSRARKMGANEAAWKAHRRKLLAEFKTKHPDRWTLLYGDKPAE